MIYNIKDNEEQNLFTAFIEQTLGVLASEDYTSFLSLFDKSKLTEQDIVLALRYLDESRPVTKIDDPTQVKGKNGQQKIFFTAFKDGSGFHMDYDLTTNGERNDLTIQVDFFKEEDGYIVVLDDLHTL